MKSLKSTKRKVEKRVYSASIDVLNLLLSNTSIQQISAFRKTSIQNTYKVIKGLIKKGYVKKVGGLYELTPNSLKILAVSRKNPFFNSQVRTHNLKFKFKVIQPTDYFNKIPRTLIRKKYHYKNIKLQNNEQYIFSHKNIKVIITTKSFILCMPHIYSRTAIEGFERALDLALDTIPILESMFNVVLIKAQYTNIQVISQEYALLRNELAKKYRKEGEKLFIRDKDGLWLIVDFSLNQDELETIGKSALEDSMVVHRFFNDLKKTDMTLTDIRKEYHQDFSMLAKQVQAHLLMINEMKDLIKTFKRLSKDLRDK